MVDADCKATPNTPRCEVGKRRCVQCLQVDDNCGQGRYCENLNGNYICLAGCKDDAECKLLIPGGQGRCCRRFCIDSAMDSLNCGACGKACVQGQSCRMGVCS